MSGYQLHNRRSMQPVTPQSSIAVPEPLNRYLREQITKDDDSAVSGVDQEQPVVR